MKNDFMLEEISLSDVIRDHGYLVKREKVDNYLALEPINQPPIVLEEKSLGLDLIDGVHHFEASLLRGDKKIKAYIHYRKK